MTEVHYLRRGLPTSVLLSLRERAVEDFRIRYQSGRLFVRRSDRTVRVRTQYLHKTRSCYLSWPKRNGWVESENPIPKMGFTLSSSYDSRTSRNEVDRVVRLQSTVFPCDSSGSRWYGGLKWLNDYTIPTVKFSSYGTRVEISTPCLQDWSFFLVFVSPSWDVEKDSPYYINFVSYLF